MIIRSPATSTATSSFSWRCNASITAAGSVTVVEFPTRRSFTTCIDSSFLDMCVYVSIYTRIERCQESKSRTVGVLHPSHGTSLLHPYAARLHVCLRSLISNIAEMTKTLHFSTPLFHTSGGLPVKCRYAL